MGQHGHRRTVIRATGRCPVGVRINHAPATMNMHWLHRPYTVYMAVLYTKQGAVKLSKMLVKSMHCPHSKHESPVTLLKLLMRYNDLVDYKGENGQR